MSWKDFKKMGRLTEEAFAKKHLTHPIWATDYEDKYEHWDVKGALNGAQILKFDVKGLKKKNRWDKHTQDECAWVEGTNVHGHPGWIKGQADYIVFERDDCWLLVNREELREHVSMKLQEYNYIEGKKPYHVYQRAGRNDKITLVPYEDIEKLRVRKLEK